MNCHNMAGMRELVIEVREPGFKSPWRYHLFIFVERVFISFIQTPSNGGDAGGIYATGEKDT
jgi:hypothetical protein